MVDHSSNQIYNVVLLGHGGSGKTTLSEATLYMAGATKRVGKVSDGNTVSDFDQEEINRHISIKLSVLPFEWNDKKVNMLDTPGYADFVGETREGIRVADSGLVLMDAVSGVEVGTELVWAASDERNLPRFLVINKMDRENADFQRSLSQAQEIFGAAILPLLLPIGKDDNFRGVLDVVRMKAYMGPDAAEAEVPADLQNDAEAARLQLVETAVEQDDDLMMKYLEGEELSPEEILKAVRSAVAKGALVPVIAASGETGVGLRPMIQAVVDYSPSAAEHKEVAKTFAGDEVTLEPNPSGPLAALAFKTMADPFVGKLTYLRVYSGILHSDSRVYNPRTRSEERIGQLFMVRGKDQNPVESIRPGDIGAVAKLSSTITGDTLCDRDNQIILEGISFPAPIYSVAVYPKGKGDSAKLGSSLSRLVEEDPTLQWHQEPSTRETILSGMGDMHLLIAVKYLENKFGVSVETKEPKVPYLETITKTARAQYRHKKQTGGAGQFAEVHLRVEPLPRGGGFEYLNEVFGGAISSAFIPSIEKGIKQVMSQGVLAGFPVVDVRAAVYDGKEHPVDSKDIAFQIAGREAFKKAVLEASPVLLEPIMNVRIVVPGNFMGDVLGDLNTRRARIQGMEQEKGKSIITAQVPLAEMQRYATDLRSITQGRGVYTMELSHYAVVPTHIASEVIEKLKKEQEEN